MNRALVLLSALAAGCAGSPHTSCDSMYEMNEGDPCSFEGRCTTEYFDFVDGRCGNSGWECVGGAVEPYEVAFPCRAPAPADAPDGRDCTRNDECAGGFCYGSVSDGGAFGATVCQSACLAEGDRGRFCDDDLDCCAGTCLLGAGEREGLCAR